MITGNARQLFSDYMAAGSGPRTAGHDGSIHVEQLIINHHNAHVASTTTQVGALHKAIVDQRAKVQTLEGKQTETETKLDAQKTAQATTEAALRAEISVLKNQLEAATTRLDTQKIESETKIHQLETKLHNLALSYQEILEQVMQLTSRVNLSSLASSYAPTEVGDDDDRNNV